MAIVSSPRNRPAATPAHKSGHGFLNPCTLDEQAAEPAGDRHAGLPYLHSVRVPSLAPGSSYAYSVTQGATTRSGIVVTLPASSVTSGLAAGSGVRLFVVDPNFRARH